MSKQSGIATPGAIKASALSVRGPHGDLPARLYEPGMSQEVAKGLIVFFPPGGFVTADLDAVDDFIRALVARTDIRVLASTYTVAGARPFPAAAEDAYAVLHWAARHAEKKRWSDSALACGGIEAGGNLAAVSAMMARDRCGPNLAAQLLIMPMLDPGLTSCSMRSLARGTERVADDCAAGYRDYLPRAIDRTHPYACPLQSSRMKGLPPALILSAEDDPLRDEAEAYGAKLITAGIKTLVRRLPPVGFQEPDARCSCARKDIAINEIAAFLAGLKKNIT